jgi:hypothetical protein
MIQQRRYLSYLLWLWQESDGANEMPGEVPDKSFQNLNGNRFPDRRF